jgi:SAM-dependent methyltransferase
VAGTSEAGPFGGPHAVSEPPRRGGVVDARPGRGATPDGGAAARLNAWRLTTRAYEPLWRHRSVGILTRGAFSTARELATLRAWTAPHAGSMALDLGCSSGLYARTLAAAGAHVHALDASRAFLLEAGRRATAEGRALTLVQGDAHALPYRPATFDLVALGATLNELAEPERAVAEVGRVLRPGGRAWFMYVARAGRLGRPLQAVLGLGGLRFPDPVELDAWAAAAGLVAIRAERRGPLVIALYGRGAGAPPVALSAPGTGWVGPSPARRRRHAEVPGPPIRGAGATTTRPSPQTSTR